MESGAGAVGGLKPEARLPLREVAKRLGRKPITVRRWFSRPDLNERFRASSLLRRDQSGRLYSTDRLIIDWENSWREEGRG